MVVPVNPTFPGRGGTPFEPQSFYVQDVVGLTPDYGKLFRGVWRSLPEAQRSPEPDVHSWTWSYNLNLIGQDRLPAGKRSTDLVPSQVPYELTRNFTWQWGLNLPQYYQSTSRNLNLPGVIADDLPPAYSLPYRIDQTWAGSYNQNLIGKDRLPTGEQVWELSPRDYPRLSTYTWLQSTTALTLPITPTTNAIFRPYWRGLPVPPPAPLLQQSAFPNFNVLQPTVVTYIIRQSDWPNPTVPAPPVQSWAWWYNQNLIGRDAMLVGEQNYALAPSQVVPDQVQLRAWQWSYNLNLIGKDRLPTGEQVYDLVPAQRTPEQIQLHYWTWQYNQNLIGKDQLPTGEQVYDLVPAQKPAEQPQLRVWTWSYNLNLIGQDRLPTGEQIWERPTLPIPPAQTWLDLPKYSLIAKPFSQSDWPNPTQPYRVEQTWARSYNLSLIGQDRMATGEQRTELPPQPPIPPENIKTWIQAVNLALVVTPAVLDILKPQRDWPVPRGPEPDWRRSWEWQYNLNLIGKDQLPVRQQDWPVPIAPAQAAQGWIDQTKILLTAVQRPFVQSDWQIPQQPAQQVQTWINTIGLLLLKPFSQTDWPNPTQPERDPSLRSFAGRYNLNLIGQDRLPNRQQDWPLSSAHALGQIPLQIMVAGKPFFLVPVQPLPPGVQFHGILYDRFIDPQRAAADIAWPAWRWPQITPPPVSAQVPLRTLMGTGV